MTSSSSCKTAAVYKQRANRAFSLIFMYICLCVLYFLGGYGAGGTPAHGADGNLCSAAGEVQDVSLHHLLPPLLGRLSFCPKKNLDVLIYS